MLIMIDGGVRPEKMQNSKVINLPKNISCRHPIHQNCNNIKL